MTTYTPDDFARASFARKGDRLAMRLTPADTHPWRTLHAWWTDENMATDGWTPVVEATPPPSGKFVDLADRVTADASHSMTWIASVRETLHWLDEHPEAVPRPEARTLTLDDLQAAWDGAEVADVAYEGDTLISRGREGDSWFWVATGDVPLTSNTHVLRRAPEPPTVEDKLAEYLLTGLDLTSDPRRAAKLSADILDHLGLDENGEKEDEG